MKKNYLLLVLLLWHLGLHGKENKTPGLDQQPLSFQENKGQIRNQQGETRTDIDFILKSKDVTLFIGKGQLHYQYIKQDAKNTIVYTKNNPPKSYHTPGGITMYRVDVNLLNSNKNASIQKDEPQQGQFHYYNTPAEVTGVNTYSKIIYRNIYPNIDWVLYTKGNEFKYDFILHPGAKVSDIQMKYDGASAMKLNTDGSLAITTPLGSIKEDKPYSYDADSKQKVSSSFALNDNVVSFKTGKYKNTLVIDPGVQWATYFGGTSAEGATSMALDKDGYIYICGLTQSNSNIATTGAHQTARGGGYNDAFLAKFDTLGQLQWATYYGGGGTGSPLSGAEINVAVSADNFGHVYLAGTTLSATNIATTNGFQNAINPVPAGLNGANGFLVQFNSSGVRQWGTYYGASSKNTKFWSVANDPYGNVYVAGDADSSSSTTGALVTPGTHQTVCAGDYDGLIVKFDSTGQRKWATYYGGVELDDINAIICDKDGSIFITGITFDSPDGIATAGTHESTWIADAEGFVAKFDSTGQREWGTYIHGKGQDLALDPYNHLYVGGHTQASTADSFIVSAGCHQGAVELGSQHNGFLMQFDPGNGTRNWGTFYGAEFTTMGYTLDCDSSGNVFFGGDTKCYATITSETIATEGSHQDTLGSVPGLNNPPSDAFIVQFDSLGHRKWATYYGGTAGDGGKALSCDPGGVLYLAGGSSSTTAIATTGVYQSTIGGSGDAFLVRMLPVDMAIKGLVTPDNDTICSGETPLSVRVKNQGRMSKTDTLFISYVYAGPANGNLDTFFTDDMLVGATDTFGLGNIDFQFAGDYEFTVYLRYTRDDNERNNDTLHFTTTVTNALPVADINVSQVGTVFHFSNNNAQPADHYQWNFGDGDNSTAANPSHEYDVSGTYTVTLIVTNFCGSDTATVEVEGIGEENGINTPGNDLNLAIYPNPANQTLYIKTDAGIALKEFTVMNLLGQTLLHGSLKNRSAIELQGLASGAYFIRVNTDKGMLTRQFRIIRK